MPKQNFVKKEHPNTTAIYDAIERSMFTRKLRQEDVGKKLRIKQNTVSHHLKNRSFDKDQLNELLDFLDLEIKVEIKACVKH